MSAQVHRITPRGHRTPEQIREQLEARMAELEREAQKPECLYPCVSCRWHKNPALYDRCYQPLVVGFDRDGYVFTHSIDAVRLCGTEKALWEPKQPYWQRFTEWLSRMIERFESNTHGKGDR